MFVNARAFTGLVIAVFAAVPALASDLPSRFDCSETIDGKRIEAVATADDVSYTMKLTVDGKEATLLGGKCFVSTRPSTRYTLCSFQLADDLRVEIYPVSQTTGGTFKTMQYVIWRGDAPQAGAFGSCAQ